MNPAGTLELAAVHAVVDTKMLRAWNRAERGEAVETILPCNGSRAWAAEMAARRPLQSAQALCEAADEVWRALGEGDRQEAFHSHPRLGEARAAAATPQSLHWSKGEQSAVGPDQAARSALAHANRAYEARFGRIFLLCASGRSAVEMLRSLQQRMGNDPDTEASVAAEEQRKITQLRLRKWLGLAPEPVAAGKEIR